MLDPMTGPKSGTAIVLGAGIAGLAAAEKLSSEGYRVHVIESTQRAGGNHRSCDIGPYTFDVGSIFYEGSARLFGLAPGLKDLCPEVLSVQCRIDPAGAIRVYPLEPRDILNQPLHHLVHGGMDLLASRLLVRRDGSLDAICRKRLGSKFYAATGLHSYISRFHHVAPAELDEEFFFHRMAIIDKATRLGAVLKSASRAISRPRQLQADKRWPMHVRPRSGFDTLFAPIVSRLRARGVAFSFGEEVQSVRREGPIFQVRVASGSHFADAVVSTIPVEALHKAMFGSGSGLESLDMTTLFVSAAHLGTGAANVLYNFHPQGRWKRMTIYSRIYPDPAIDRAYFAVEITLPAGLAHAPDAAFADFRDHLSALGLARDLRLEGSELVRDCYPLYRAGAHARLKEVIARIEAFSIILAGRQGRFEYLPTSSGVIRRVTETLATAGICAADRQIAA